MGSWMRSFLRKMLVERGRWRELVWHRAIDVCLDPIVAANILTDYGVREILGNWSLYMQLAGLGIQTLREFCDVGLEVMAGGGVGTEDIVSLGEAGVAAVHASCRKKQSFDGANSLEAESELFDLSVYSVDYEKVSTLATAVLNFNS